MAASEGKLVFILGSDEPPFDSPPAQSEFEEAYEAMKAHGLAVEPRILVRKSVGGGVSFLGEFLVQNPTAAITVFGTIVVAFLHGRAGRKVRLKIGDKEAEARTVEEVEKLLQLAQEYEASPEGKDEAKP